MSVDQEPNAGDILASKVGVNGIHGHIWALHILLTSLLIVLRKKGTMDAHEIDGILDATSTTLSEKFERLSRETPKGAEHFKEMNDRAMTILEIIRRDVTASPSSQ